MMDGGGKLMEVAQRERDIYSSRERHRERERDVGGGRRTLRKVIHPLPGNR